MGEEPVGWIASQSIGRLSYREYKGGFGYGLFFTSNRLLGVSYKGIVSRALRPAYVIEVFSFALLGTLLTYFGVTRPPPEQTMPLWIILLIFVMFGGWIIALIIFLYSGPKQIARRIQQEASSQILNLATMSGDLSVERANISQITIEEFRLSILTKSGEWFLLGVRDPNARGVRTQVVGLFERFCTIGPPIGMFIKQKDQWTVVSNAQAR